MGTWARLTALLAVAGTGLAVVSGAAGWGTAHRVLAAVALPPLATVELTVKLFKDGVMLTVIVGEIAETMPVSRVQRACTVTA